MPAPKTTRSFTPVPRGLAEQLLPIVSPACVCLALIVLDHTNPAPAKQPVGFWRTTREELAKLLNVTTRQVYNLLHEAESCIADSPIPSSRFGILTVLRERGSLLLKFDPEVIDFPELGGPQ